MASWEEPIHACAKDLYCTLWADGQAVCIDVKLHGTLVGPSQTSAILVLLHEYGRVLGGCIIWIYDVIPHILWFMWSQSDRRRHIYDAIPWQSLHMTTFDLHNSLTNISSSSFRTNHDHFRELFGHGYILLILVGCKQTRSNKKLWKKDSSMKYIVIVLQGGINHGINPACNWPRNLPLIPLIGRKREHVRHYTWCAIQYGESTQHRDVERARQVCL
jgi:hypothetical protein